MTADELIHSYVSNVVTLLPRGQRRDVAQELRALLTEELDGSVEGAASREEAARALLAGFGRPAEVAARYGPPVTVIDAADTRRFTTLALAGAVLAIVGAYLNALIDPAGDPRRAMDLAWPFILGWVGLLVVVFAFLAWLRRRRPDALLWRPHPLPTDRINRPGRLAALAFFIVGTAILVQPVWLIREITGGRASHAAYQAFTYDGDFLSLRGPVVLALMIIGLGIQTALIWRGRWRSWLHWTEMVYGLVLCLVLTWTVSGRIFAADPTDQAVKGAIALIILGTLIDLALRARRHHVRQATQATLP